MKTTNVLKTAAVWGVAALFIGACSSKPKNYQPLPATTDPNAAIETLKRDLASARADNVPELAPNQWDKSKNAYDKAVKARAKNKSNDKILQDVAISKAYLETAQSTAKANSQVMQPILAARQSALDAKADTLAPKQFEKAEKYARSVASDTASDGYRVIEKRGNKAIERYQEARGEAYSAQFTDRSRALVQAAKNEGAKKYAPVTLERVEKQIDAVDKSVRMQNQVSPELAQQAQMVEQNAEKLLTLTRTSKSASGLTDEQVGQRLLDQDQRLAALMERNEIQQQRLSRTNRALASSQESLESAREKAKPQEVFDKVRSQFSPREADVLMSGDNKVLVRMKSLTFPTGSATIPPRDASLLEKLGDTIKDVGASKVVVEGHTDSTGSPTANRKLSERRAQSVGEYLATKTALGGEKIETEGFGDTKPLTSNKTKAGRAENRRVDVVIEL